MKIKINQKFVDKLLDQIDYIAKDKPLAASQFQKDLMSKIDLIADFPFSSRQSIYSENPNVRDLIFKGYVITYRVNEKEGSIEIFSLIKYQKS